MDVTKNLNVLCQAFFGGGRLVVLYGKDCVMGEKGDVFLSKRRGILL